MNYTKMTKANLVLELDKYSNITAKSNKAITRLERDNNNLAASNQSLHSEATDLRKELLELIENLLEVFKNAPTKSGFWYWLKAITSSSFRKELMDVINFIRNHKK